MVFTNGCIIDKRSNSGAPTIERLQLLPLLNVDELDPNRRGLIRKDDLQPPEPLYLGTVDMGSGEWDAYVVLRDLYAVLVSMIGEREMVDHSVELGSDEGDPYRLHINGDEAERVYSMADETLEKLHQKIAMFWIGKQLIDG